MLNVKGKVESKIIPSWLMSPIYMIYDKGGKTYNDELE